MKNSSLMPRYHGKGNGNPDPVDIHVGSRIRFNRTEAGLSQETLAEALGITFQQVQKYERGTNRVSASRLYQLALIFNVPIGSFFDGFEEGPRRTKRGKAAAEAGKFEWLETEGGDLMERQETRDLLRLFFSIKSQSVRRNFTKLLKSFVAAGALAT
jgi:transcriptional regulator with XRE-family HTH domain